MLKAAVLRKRVAKLLKRQHKLLHEVDGVYGADYEELLAQCAARMREHGLIPHERLDSALLGRVLNT